MSGLTLYIEGELVSSYEHQTGYMSRYSPMERGPFVALRARIYSVKTTRSTTVNAHLNTKHQIYLYSPVQSCLKFSAVLINVSKVSIQYG